MKIKCYNKSCYNLKNPQDFYNRFALHFHSVKLRASMCKVKTILRKQKHFNRRVSSTNHSDSRFSWNISLLYITLPPIVFIYFLIRDRRSFHIDIFMWKWLSIVKRRSLKFPFQRERARGQTKMKWTTPWIIIISLNAS